MKNLLLASAAALALTAVAGTAGAADLPRGPAYKAPMMVPDYYNWTGFYIGGHAGATFGDGDAIIAGAAPVTSRFQGALGGGQAGAQIQFGNFVLGIEGDLSGTNAGGSVSGCATFAGIPFDCRGQMNWMATLRGRAGIAWDRSLFYVTGGGMAAGVDVATVFSAFAPPLEFTDSQTMTGWTFGGGFEFGLYQNWSAKIEYLYFQLDTTRFNLATGGIAGTLPVDASVDGSLVRVGVNYRFGNWMAPVQARY